MANVTAATGLVTIDGVQRTAAEWWRRNERFEAVARIGNLAARDGWDGLYNPGDPDSFSSDSAKLFDSLGNLSTFVQNTGANKFSTTANEFGPLTGLVGNGTSTFMATAAFSQGSQAQPNIVLATAKCNTPTTNQYLLSGITSTDRHDLYISSSFWRSGAGVALTGPASSSAKTIHGTLFNGVSSKRWTNATVTTADTGAQAITGLTLGAFWSATQWWNGTIGPVAIRFDGDEDAFIRMRDLINSLCAIY